MLRNIVWYTGPHNLTSLTRDITRWAMLSKKDGGKNIFNSYKITTISSSSSCDFTGSMTLQQMEEKNEHKRVMVCLTFFGKIPRIATSNNYCIKMWQFWDLNLISFKSCIDIRLFTFEECPFGTFTPFRHDKNLFIFIFWHGVTGWGQICMLTHLYWCWRALYVHLNQI